MGDFFKIIALAEGTGKALLQPNLEGLLLDLSLSLCNIQLCL